MHTCQTIRLTNDGRPYGVAEMKLRIGDIVQLSWCKAVVFGKMTSDYRCLNIGARLMECGPAKRTFMLSVNPPTSVRVIEHDLEAAATAWQCLADEMAIYESRARLTRTKGAWRALKMKYSRRCKRIQKLAENTTVELPR